VPRIAAVTGATGVVLVACAGLAGVVAVPVTSTTAALGSGSGAASGASASVSHVGGKAAHAAAGNSAEPTGPLRTSCTSVAHIGDSTSEGMVSADYLPRHLRLAAQYENVGVQSVFTDITGARSVVEVLPGTTNGQQAVHQLIKQGFHGCWVLALGTNDTADIAVGSNVSLPERISDMMKVTQGEPVMWVNVVSLLRNGPYAEADMQKWNDALTQACARYPNMRVFNWAVLPQRSWFINDGIHYTSAGYAKRGQYIADGLAEAFPLGRTNSTCLVSLPSSVAAPQPSPSPSSPSPAGTAPASTARASTARASTARASTAPASTGPKSSSASSSPAAKASH
jgi:lysophospholipase L1-like esterase